MSQYFNLAKCICVDPYIEPYVYVPDEWDDEKEWFRITDNAKFGDSEHNEEQTS